jgi:hypothetical protein
VNTMEQTVPSFQTQTEPNSIGRESQVSKSQTHTEKDTSPSKTRDLKLESTGREKRLEVQAPIPVNQNTATFHGTKSIHHYTKTHTPRTQTSRPPTGVASFITANNKWLPSAVMFLGIFVAAILIFHNANRIIDLTFHLAKQVSDKGSAILTSTTPKPPEPDLDIPPKAMKAHVMVHSVPDGALIDVDGQNLGTTPSEILVDINKRVSILLRRDGYIPYAKQFVASSSPQAFTATLQKAIVGYLNIDVRPTTASIFINGEKLAEKTPITKYPVPAGKTLVIRGVNPYLNTSDEQTVTVKQDTVKNIVLFLHK